MPIPSLLDSFDRRGLWYQLTPLDFRFLPFQSQVDNQVWVYK